MAILITGAAGFVGFHTARRLLERGEEIVGIDNLNSYYDVNLKIARHRHLQERFHNQFKFLHCDFTSQETLEAVFAEYEITSVIHLGAQAGVRYARTHPHAYIQSNIVGHANIMECCRRSGTIRHLVYASSSSVYGSNSMAADGFAVDQRVDNPRSLYAATKRADELLSESYSYLYRLPQTGLRFFTVYGPWGRPDMAMWIFTKAILEGNPITLFNDGNMRRDFTFIDDIVTGVVASHDHPPADDGLRKAGGSTSPHRVFNIGNHRSEELLHMVAVIEQAVGRTAIKQFAPMQADDVQDTFADINAIQQELGYRPTTPIEVGVPKFVSWYRQYHDR